MSSTTSTHSAQAQSTLPGHPKIAAKPAPPPAARQPDKRYGSYTRASAQAAERRAERRQRAAQRRLARKAGRAAPFLVPVGDNSIPTYGSEAEPSEQARAEADLRSYLEARQEGDWSGACDQMAEAVQKQLSVLAGESGGAKGCPNAYAKLASRIPAQARKSVLVGPLVAFRVKEGKAFALFYGPHNHQYMMPMVDEGGAWRVNQIEAVAWPLGGSGG